MARPREFNQDDVLDGAIDIFWRRGYGATNLPDLLTAMNMSRGSFYGAFIDKRRAYVAALKRYEDVYLVKLLNKLSAPLSSSLAEHLLILYEQIDSTGPLELRRGCFICNAMAEFGTSDAEITQSVTRMSGAIEATLTTVLKTAGKTESQAQTQAKALLQIYYGAQTLSKSGGGASDFLTIIKAIIA